MSSTDEIDPHVMFEDRTPQFVCLGIPVSDVVLVRGAVTTCGPTNLLDGSTGGRRSPAALLKVRTIPWRRWPTDARLANTAGWRPLRSR